MRTLAIAIIIAAYGMLSRFFPSLSLSVVADGPGRDEEAQARHIVAHAADLLCEQGWCEGGEGAFRPRDADEAKRVLGVSRHFTRRLNEHDFSWDGYGRASLIDSHLFGLCLSGALRAAHCEITGALPETLEFPAAELVADHIRDISPDPVPNRPAAEVITSYNDIELVEAEEQEGMTETEIEDLGKQRAFDLLSGVAHPAPGGGPGNGFASCGAAAVERSFDAQILYLAADLIERHGWCQRSEVFYASGPASLTEACVITGPDGTARLDGEIEGLCLSGALRAAVRIETGEMPDACRFAAAEAVALRVARDPVGVTEDVADAVIAGHNDFALVPLRTEEEVPPGTDWHAYQTFLADGRDRAAALLRSVADACDLRGRP